MSDFLLTRSGAVIDFRPMAKGAWALVFSHGSWIPWVGLPGDLSGSRPLSEIEAIKLTSLETWLTERSKAAFDLLLKNIHDARIVASAFDCYRFYLKMYGAERRLKPRKIGQNESDCLLFEILCFAIFQIIVREIPAYLRGKYHKDGALSVSRGVLYFSQRLLDSLENRFDTLKIKPGGGPVSAKTRPRVQPEPGELQDAARRMSAYLEARSREEELRIFSNYAGCVIDPLNLQITEIVALSHTGRILDVISRTLSVVFEG